MKFFLFKLLDKSASYRSIFSSLWYANLPCYDLRGLTAQSNGDSAFIKFCSWRGISIPCSQIFTTFPTDQGLCCSFNMKSAETIFEGSTYPHLIKNLQSFDRSHSFHTTTSKLGTEIRPGKSNILTLYIDGHSDLLSPGSVMSDSAGFDGIIMPAGSMPLSTFSSFSVRPGENISYI
jgi:hypothetical protein